MFPYVIIILRDITIKSKIMMTNYENKFSIKEISIDITPPDVDGEYLLVFKRSEEDTFSHRVYLSKKTRNKEEGIREIVDEKERQDIIDLFYNREKKLPLLDIPTMRAILPSINYRSEINNILSNKKL
jgi:hypothetical protein